MSSSCTALLKCQQLLGTEGLVVDLGGCFDQVLKVCARKEVSEIDKFAVVLILNVDNSPSILTAADLLASNNDRLLGSNDCEGDDVLLMLADYLYLCTLEHKP